MGFVCVWSHKKSLQEKAATIIPHTSQSLLSDQPGVEGRGIRVGGSIGRAGQHVNWCWEGKEAGKNGSASVMDVGTL